MAAKYKEKFSGPRAFRLFDEEAVSLAKRGASGSMTNPPHSSPTPTTDAEPYTKVSAGTQWQLSTMTRLAALETPAELTPPRQPKQRQFTSPPRPDFSRTTSAGYIPPAAASHERGTPPAAASPPADTSPAAETQKGNQGSETTQVNSVAASDPDELALAQIECAQFMDANGFPFDPVNPVCLPVPDPPDPNAPSTMKKEDIVPLICFVCFRTGHFARECPFKAYATLPSYLAFFKQNWENLDVCVQEYLKAQNRGYRVRRPPWTKPKSDQEHHAWRLLPAPHSAVSRSNPIQERPLLPANPRGQR